MLNKCELFIIIIMVWNIQHFAKWFEILTIFIIIFPDFALLAMLHVYQ